MLLVDRFASVASQTPDAIAIVDKAHSATYAELYQLSNKVANYLASVGLMKGDRVALLAANSVEYVAIFYGIWIAGGVTVALNTQAKARDVINWIDHSGAKWLFVDAKHPERPDISRSLSSTHSIIPIYASLDSAPEVEDNKWQSIVESKISAKNAAVSLDDIASIIYTSGTTGQPKGVTLTHRNLASNIDSILAYLKLDNSDSTVNVLPFYFSYGNSILHTHIAVGAKMVLENSLLYPHVVVERIQNERVTGFSGVPSTYALLLGRVKLEDYDLSSLRYLTQAGGPMPPAVTDKLTQIFANTDIFIMYGQTEAAARLTYLPHEKLKVKRGSVGIPIPGVEISIFDADKKTAKPGETGEICARGDNIMLGYWNNKEQTGYVLYDGWLHTGDLGHYDEDGFIYIDGRSSEMIKTGGNRISPQEVEEVIQEVEGVQEAAVVGIEDEMLGESIKAYVVATLNASLDPKSILLHCRKNLAIYKIPKKIELVDSLPKTASGKIQHYLLKKREETHD